VLPCERSDQTCLSFSGLAGLIEGGEEPLDELVGLRAQVVGDSTLREFHNDDNMTSGSGSGMPHLVSRTLAKMIELGDRIGKNPFNVGPKQIACLSFSTTIQH